MIVTPIGNINTFLKQQEIRKQISELQRDRAILEYRKHMKEDALYKQISEEGLIKVKIK